MKLHILGYFYSSTYGFSGAIPLKNSASTCSPVDRNLRPGFPNVCSGGNCGPRVRINIGSGYLTGSMVAPPTQPVECRHNLPRELTTSYRLCGNQLHRKTYGWNGVVQGRLRQGSFTSFLGGAGCNGRAGLCRGRGRHRRYPNPRLLPKWISTWAIGSQVLRNLKQRSLPLARLALCRCGKEMCAPSRPQRKRVGKVAM